MEVVNDNIDPMDLVKEQNRDGQKWAKSFIDMHGSKLIGLDESDMIGWFCSAMMSMHDSLYNNEIKVLMAKIDKLKSLVLLTDDSVSGVEVGTTQLKQWGEYCKEFPDELQLEDKK